MSTTPHFNCQVNKLVLLVSSYLGLDCSLYCILHCLVARFGTYHTDSTSYLSLSFIHELNVMANLTNGQIVFVRQVMYAFLTLSRCRNGWLNCFVAHLNISMFQQLHRYNLPTYLRASYLL